MAILDFDIDEINLATGEKSTAISLTGSIDATTNQQFEEELTEILTKGIKKVILLLSGIKYINSTGLGTIVKCVDTFREAGGDIKMVAIPTKVIALFEMLGLLALFETFDTIEEAVNSFAGEETAEAATGPRRVKKEFPIQLKCSSCRAGINIREPGKYKCPKCGDYFSAEEDGTVETYAIRKPNVIQLQIPLDRNLAESIKLMAVSSVVKFGVSQDNIQPIASSIDEVFSIVDAQEILPNENIIILIVTDEQKFSIGFVNYKNVLSVNEEDAHFQNLQQYMDEVRIIELPSRGGNMLTMNKAFE
ncbi:STAS domain-containing protein [Planctomycetota bacterium]